MWYNINKLEDVEDRLDVGAVPTASTINASVPCVDPLNREATY